MKILFWHTSSLHRFKFHLTKVRCSMCQQDMNIWHLMLLLWGTCLFTCVWCWGLYIGKFGCHPDQYDLCQAKGYTIIKLGSNGCALSPSVSMTFGMHVSAKNVRVTLLRLSDAGSHSDRLDHVRREGLIYIHELSDYFPSEDGHLVKRTLVKTNFPCRETPYNLTLHPNTHWL